MREKVDIDKGLVHRISGRVTAATVHRFNGLLQGYYGWIYVHNKNVESNAAELVCENSYSKVRNSETQLRLFK